MNNMPTMPNPQTEVYHLNDADGWELKPIIKDKRPFTGMPPIRTGLTPNRKPDLLDLLGDLSKGARDLFLHIKTNMNFTTYLAVLPNHELTQSQINKRSQAIQELECMGDGLALRVPTSGMKNCGGLELRFKPSTFILSPEYLYPNHKYRDEIENIWRQCLANRHLKAASSP